MDESRPDLGDTPYSRVQLPQGAWTTVLEGLCARFPAIAPETWLDRFQRGMVLDSSRQPIKPGAAYRVGMEVRYFREVRDEPVIPFKSTVLYVDEHIVVIDKPHFLPVVPAGGFVRETVLARLVKRLGNPNLVPLHRIDRATAGLVLFSANPATRARYQSLFRERQIEKRYEALAPPLRSVSFPHVRCSRLVRGEPFFRTTEVEGDANSETRIDVIGQREHCWRYALEPVTGRKHQLRVHMAALGAAILNDLFYPDLQAQEDDDHSRPLQLLARSLSFLDPLSGRPRYFESVRSLQNGASTHAS